MRARDFSSRPRPGRPTARERALLYVSAAALAWCAYAAGAAWRGYREARAAVDDLRREAAETARRAESLGVARGAGPSVLGQAALTLEAPPPRVAVALARVLPPGVRVEGLALRYTETLRLQMDVSARTAPAYDAFLQRLAGDRAFADVLPGNEARGATGVTAHVQATWTGDRR